MMLILTHENADFDAVASQLAAKKLYPEGVPLLPRRINRNVNQFLTLYWDILPFTRLEDWKRKRVDRVLLVDTQTINSVRGMVKKLSVRVIDHHIIHHKRENWSYQVETIGATTTLLVEMLQSAGLILTAEEATLLLLGIYEDTGSLTYGTTTPRDARAAAWLLENGAQLAVVSKFLNIPLTSEQRNLYEALQKSSTWLDVGGHSIVVATAVAPEDFDDEISSVAHRLRDALSPMALFVLVQIHNDVQLVARSTNSYIDASVVARGLGGGGHERAAAAMVVGKSLSSVKDKVVALLPEAIKPMATVTQIMSYGVQILSPDVIVSEAASLMQRSGHEGYPVYSQEEQKLVGLLTRRAVDRAVSHGLENLPVSRIMKAGSVMVRPSDSIDRLQQLMLDEGWGQIPVLSEGEDGIASPFPIGIVTRTDILNFLFKLSPEPADSNMRQLLETSLPPAMWGMLLVVSQTADSLQMPLYFVGGVVRDVLLNMPATDLDMVVEGDAIKLVRQLQEKFGGEIHTHSRFGTAKWFVTPEIWQAAVPDTPLDGILDTIDFVTARTEFYKKPSALPEVERGSIKLDLHRRDFTINTLAIRLDGLHLGELLDFYGGRRDLEQKLIRVLHSLSFIDDPTRILRAVRLEQRLKFRIESRTAELINAALPMLDRVTGSRIRHEIELALNENSPARTLERLSELKVLAQIHPGIEWTPQMTDSYARVPQLRKDPTWREIFQRESLIFIYFGLWMAPLPIEIQESVLERLRVRKLTRDDVISISKLMDTLGNISSDAPPSQVTLALRPYRQRVLLVARAAANNPGQIYLLDQYYTHWRHIRTAVTGETLRELGLKPGPEYAIILDRLLAAKLDREIVDEEGERALLDGLLTNKSKTS